MKILVSAGEASGDLYCSRLITHLRAISPGPIEFFGCAGPLMRATGVRNIVDSESLSVVGLFEVIRHIPGIYGEFRKLIAAAKREKPELAILTDSPDFNLRLAKKLKKQGIPVVYLVAPQAWAWRKWRTGQMARDLAQLYCIFPFEEPFFTKAGVPTRYIGHPLARIIKPRWTRDEFRARHGLDPSKPIITLLPGSRLGETDRHLEVLVHAAELIRKVRSVNFLWATGPGFLERADLAQLGARFRELISSQSIQVVEAETWEAIAASRIVLAASGTVTMEAALLGIPMVSFYKVSQLSWNLGRWLVDVPHLTMVNLIAGKRIVPELMQNDCTASRLAEEALRILDDGPARSEMMEGLAEVTAKLHGTDDPLEAAARHIRERFL